MKNLTFHCDEKSNFNGDIDVRSFSYSDYAIGMHNHDFYEVNIVMAGKGIHCIENSRFSVRVGDVFVIPPMVTHAYVDTEKLEVYHIILRREYIEKNREEAERVQGFLQLMEIEPFLRQNASERFFLHLSPQQLLQLRQELYFTEDGGAFEGAVYSMLKYHAVWKILYWLSALLTEQNRFTEMHSGSSYELQIMQALEYIHLHYSEKITVDRLCGEVFLSRATFLRNFRNFCGTSPMAYLQQYRCKKALEMMAKNSDSKTEIAHRCGFYDLSHMERTLRGNR